MCWEHHNFSAFLGPTTKGGREESAWEPGWERQWHTRLITECKPLFCACERCDKIQIQISDALVRAKRNKNDTLDSGKGPDRRLHTNSTKAQIQNNTILFGWSDSEKSEHKSVSVYVFQVIIVLPNRHYFFILQLLPYEERHFAPLIAFSVCVIDIKTKK